MYVSGQRVPSSESFDILGPDGRPTGARILLEKGSRFPALAVDGASFRPTRLAHMFTAEIKSLF